MTDEQVFNGWRREIRRGLDRALDRWADQLGAPSRGLARTVRRATEGGKLLRPLLCIAAHETFGGVAADPIFRVGASLELIHTFALIHDDLIDRPSTRRGRPPLHEGTEPDASFEVALLAGDAAFALAQETYWTAGFDQDALIRSSGHLWDMYSSALAGQYLEVLLSRTGPPSPSQAREVARLKSGAYSVVGPCLLGAGLAKDPRAGRMAALRSFAESFGEAFQHQDDLRPVIEDDDDDLLEDTLSHKPTLLMAHAMGDPEARAVLGAEGASASEIRRALRASGAISATQRLIDDLKAHALASLEAFASKTSALGRLTEETLSMTNRPDGGTR